MKEGTQENISLFRRLLHFFPVQLFFLHLKKNHLLLIFWLILFAYVTQSLGNKYGIPYLFLFPEYLGDVNFWSHMILGFSIGGFIMAFNIYSYILHGFRFPFIATVSRPFLKFSLNNLILPIVFIILYVMNAVKFQLNSELLSGWEVFVNMLGMVAGVLIFIIASFLYFFRTNKDLYTISGKTKEEFEKLRGRSRPVESPFHRQAKWHHHLSHDQAWRVHTYMSGLLKTKIARDSSHYDIFMLKKVFAQNHINASLFEILIITTFLVIGTFREEPFFMIPAGASIILLFTMLLMILSAFYSWFKGWTISIVIVIFLGLNYISTQTDFLHFRNYAYGMDYETAPAKYDNQNLEALSFDTTAIDLDKKRHIKILQNWKLKNTANGEEKPKLVVINVSGGGLRSAMWTYHALSHADKVTNGELLKHAHFITGASGGMIGASYLREMHLREQSGEDMNIHDVSHCDDLAKDILNPLAFNITTTDVFIRWQNFDDGDYTYTKDRAYTFETVLSENTHGRMDKRLRDYTEPEFNAQIPMMVFTPTIINDGRRLMIASQPISYLTYPRSRSKVHGEPSIENVEFTKLFEDQDAWNLKYLSAMRMSATFPYILPMVTLPSNPRIDVMDAGIRDNYGMKTTSDLLLTFKDWIEENTSGIVIIQIRDRQKEFVVKGKRNSIIQRMLRPFGSLYGNFTTTQDYNNDQLMRTLSNSFDADVDYIQLTLWHNMEDNISLSWHLTNLEKKRIFNSVDLEVNKKSYDRLKELLNVKTQKDVIVESKK